MNHPRKHSRNHPRKPRTCPRILALLFLAAALLVPGSVGLAGADDDRRPDGPPPHEHDRDFDELRKSEGDSDDRSDDRRRRSRMSDEQIESARQIVQRLYPEMTEQLEQLHAEDPAELRRTIERRFPRVRYLVKLQEKDPEMFELRMADITLGRQIETLAEQVRQAHLDDDKDAYKARREQLEDKVADHFDARQAIRELEIQMLERRVEELKDRLDEHDDDRDDLIERRVEELTGPEW